MYLIYKKKISAVKKPHKNALVISFYEYRNSGIENVKANSMESYTLPGKSEL